MLYQHDLRQVSLVTPDYPAKETIYSSSPASEDALAKEASLAATRHAINVSTAAMYSREQATLAPRPVKSGFRGSGAPPSIPLISKRSKSSGSSGGSRLNKFVRRLHDMLQAEKDSGLVEWRRGLLVLYSTDAFAKKILPKYFNTQNFKTFRRQLNYYGFVHVRSFSTTGSSTTALWVNRDLSEEGNEDISSVLKLKRVEPCEGAKTAEGRRQRKELAIFTVEEDIGVSAKTLQMDQIRSMALRGNEDLFGQHILPTLRPKDVISDDINVLTDSSASINGSTLIQDDDSADTNSAVVHEDSGATTCAANVLLMLSRA